MATMTRGEHMKWCKDRALEYVDRGELQNAVASMFSDMGKHDETRGSVGIGSILLAAVDMTNQESVRRFIEGFN